MKTFKQYINLMEGDTQTAYDMEKVIVSAAGGPAFVSTRIKNSKEVGQKIIKSLKLNGDGSFPKNSYSASSKWNKYFGPGGAKGATLTPKTDLFIGRKRISLKSGSGGARLMSGSPNEARATFYSAAEKAGLTSDKMIKNLSKHMENLLSSTNMAQLGIKGSKTDLKKAGKFASIQILKKADAAHHAFKNDLREVFKASSKFANAFTFEAMTGDIKFGHNSNGTAEYFLVTDYQGNAQLHNAFSDSAYVKKIASQVQPDVGFKSSQNVSAQLKSPTNPKGKSGYYTFFSAVGLSIKMITEEEINKGLLLNEGIFDFFKRVFNRVKNWLSNFWSGVKKAIGDKLEDLLAFMTLEPQIRFNNNIKW